MGGFNEQMLRDEYDVDLVDFLKLLLEREELEGALNGIAKQIVDKGVISMSQRQKEVVDTYVANYEKRFVCDRCSNGNVGNLTDYIFIADNTWDLCPMCERDREKYMDED